MTSNIGRLAGGVTILDALWILYVNFTSPTYVASCAPGGSCLGTPNFLHLNLVFEGLAVILLVVGGLGIWGASFSYVVGSVFSGISLVFMGTAAFETSGSANLSWEIQTIAGATIAVVAIVGNVIASRKKKVLSEQANPMNLPVFG